MTEPIADDFGEIARRLREIEGTVAPPAQRWGLWFAKGGRTTWLRIIGNMLCPPAGESPSTWPTEAEARAALMRSQPESAHQFVSVRVFEEVAP